MRTPKTSSLTSSIIDASKEFMNPRFPNEDENSKKEELEKERNYSKDLNNFNATKSK